MIRTLLKSYPCLILLLAGGIGLSSCRGSKLGNAKKGEKVVMAAPPKRDVINFYLLKQQQRQPLSLAARAETHSRGAATAFTGGLLSLGITAVREVIANEQKKYTAEWGQGLNDLYFYDQPSAEGPFDPVGMQFNGFKITRTFSDGGRAIVALSAEFEVDKDSVQADEIINDGFFRLKLKDLKINYSKAKVPFNQKTINLDFDIDFITSYIDPTGNLHKDVDLGRFFLSIRKAPLDSTATDYKAYYEQMKNKRVDGKAFIVPRSFGHYKTSNDSVVALYNQGMFSIAVNVRESSRNNFVNQMLINTAKYGLDYGQGVINDKLKKKPAAK